MAQLEKNDDMQLLKLCCVGKGNYNKTFNTRVEMNLYVVEVDSFDKDQFVGLLSSPNLNTEAVDKVLVLLCLVQECVCPYHNKNPRVDYYQSIRCVYRYTLVCAH